MSLHLRKVAVVAATVISALAVSSGSASAAPACSGTVPQTLDAAHDTVGDPAGAIHAAEVAYCAVAG